MISIQRPSCFFNLCTSCSSRSNKRRRDCLLPSPRASSFLPHRRPSAIAAVRRQLRGHGHPLAASPCPRASPATARSSGGHGRSRGAPPHRERVVFFLGPPAIPFFPDAVLLLLICHGPTCEPPGELLPLSPLLPVRMRHRSHPHHRCPEASPPWSSPPWPQLLSWPSECGNALSASPRFQRASPRSS